MKDDTREGKPMGRPRKERPDTMEGRLGERIETLRKDKGWDVVALASAAGVGNGTIQRLERGDTSPTLGTVLAVANGLGLSGEQLMRRVPDWTEKPAG